MENLIVAVEKAIAEKNWYAALSLALTIPDICAKMVAPSEGSAKRYSKWVNTYFTPKYTRRVGGDQEHIFLSGNDLYALRCAVLHEGSDDIILQRARESLERFIVIAPPPGFVIHLNQIDQVLQLQVDILCKDICESARQWLVEVRGNTSIQDRLAGLMVIREYSEDKGIQF